MKKRSSKLLALLMSISLLPAAGTVSVSAAQGTSAALTSIVEFDGQNGSLPAVTNGTAEAVENLPGKTADDKGIKLNITAEKTYAYADLSVYDAAESKSAVSARTVVFDVYPNDTVTAIQFKGRANYPNYEFGLSDEIPMSNLKSGQWNKIMLVYNPDGANSVYINNVLYKQNNTAHFGTPTSTQKFTYANVRLYVKTAASEGAYINFDNIQTAKGTAVTPAVKSGKYIIDSQIQEYRNNAAVADVLDNIIYNGTSVAVKNASGEDITENTAAKVLKGYSLYVYDGSIATGLYYFGDEHKQLTALNDNSGTVMASGFEDDSTNNFSPINADVAVQEGTNYSKPAGDKVLNVSSTNASYYIYRTTRVDDRTKVSTISFEVYPNGSWNRLDISTNSGAYFLILPADRLKVNEWNQVTLFVGGDDKSLRPNAVYINGKKVTAETTSAGEAGKIYIHNSLLMGNTATSNQQLRIGVSGAAEASNLVIDNFYQAEGQAFIPSLSSKSYNVDPMAINEYMQDTVEDVMSDITYNGSKAVIKNADGADITNNMDAVITSGNHLYIYDGDFITGHYFFKTAHEAPVIKNSHIDNFDGISVVNGTSETETGVYGKDDSDTSMKLIADTSTASTTTNTGSVYLQESLFDAQTKSIPASVVAFEVYPNNTIDEIVIAGRADLPKYEISFQKIPVSDLAANQWNRILFVYNVTGENKVYLNGSLYSGADSGHFGNTVTYGNVRVKANYTKQDGVTPYVYIDEYQDAHGRTVDPAISTEIYGIDGNTINGCTDAAANVKANINTAFGTNLVIKNAKGIELEDNETVVPGDGIYVYDGDMIIGHYYAEAGKMLINIPVIENSGTNAGDTVTARLTYTETDGIRRRFNIYLAVYDEDNRLIGVKIKTVQTTGNDGLKTISTDTLTLSETAYEIKAIVLDDNLNPLCDYGHV